MEGSKQRFEFWQPLLMAFVLCLGMILGTQLDSELPQGALMTSVEKDDDWSELLAAIQFIRSRYGDSIEIDSISDGAIRYVVDQLDPHSYYLSGSEYAYFKERIAGNYDGIGIEYESIEDTVCLTWVISDGPAFQGGLRKGDQILAINDQLVSGQGLSKEQIWEIWKDTESAFSMDVLSSQSKKTKSIQVTKGSIKVPSVPVAELLHSDIGYIKISRFASGTYAQFMLGLEELVEKGVSNLVIDVRNNPGGSLQEVVKILDQLVNEKDALLLYTKGEKTKRQEYRSTGRVFHRLDEIVVMVNEHSVSASEVLAGVLQDLGRAKIVGRRTFGKALVQEMYDLSDNAALNLSIGKYYLPSGRYIQRSYDDKDDYQNDLEIRIRSGELFDESHLAIEDYQMSASSDGVSRPIGEGVVPDVFVAIDSLYYSDHWKHRKKAFFRSTFTLLKDMDIDSTNIPYLMEQMDQKRNEILASFVPDQADTLGRENWMGFLENQFKFNLLWYFDRDQAVIHHGQDLDSDLQIALGLFQQSGDLSTQEN